MRDLLFIRRLLLFLDCHLFDLLIRGTESRILRDSFLTSYLPKSVLSLLFDLPPILLLLLALIVPSLLTE